MLGRPVVTGQWQPCSWNTCRSGKSTLVEAIAEAAGLDARGGRAGRKYGSQREKTRLGEVIDP
jgi:predicted ATPase